MGKPGRKKKEPLIVDKKVKWPLCPKCGEVMKVMDTVHTHEETYRRRVCPKCGGTIFTVEYDIEYDCIKDTWNKYSRKYMMVKEKL